MDNEVKEEVKVETKKKGNGLFTLFACIMTGVIVFLATNVGQKASKVVDPDTNGGSKESNVTSNVESNTTSNVESNVTSNVTSNVVDTTVSEVEKSYINDKISLIFGGEKVKGKQLVASSNSNVWNDFFDGKVNEVLLQKYLIANFTSYDFVPYTATNGKISAAYKDMVKNNMNNGVEALPQAKLAELYKKLTGKEMTQYVDLPIGCPIYAYDSVNKVYINVPGCGGSTAQGGVYVYFDNYTKSDNKIIVSTYVASFTTELEADLRIFSGEKQYKKLPYNTKFSIDETNKTAFPKYNITFTKSTDGQYYFNSVAKAN